MYQRMKDYIQFEKSEEYTDSIHYLMIPKQRFVMLYTRDTLYILCAYDHKRENSLNWKKLIMHFKNVKTSYEMKRNQLIIYMLYAQVYARCFFRVLLFEIRDVTCFEIYIRQAA
jgi:hypothetical protein